MSTPILHPDPERPLEVVASLRGFAFHPAGSRDLACRYLAEIEPHLSLEGLQFVAGELGVTEPEQFRRDLLTQITDLLAAGTDEGQVPAARDTGDDAPPARVLVDMLLSQALGKWVRDPGDGRSQPEVMRATLTNSGNRRIVVAWLAEAGLTGGDL